WRVWRGSSWVLPRWRHWSPCWRSWCRSDAVAARPPASAGPTPPPAAPSGRWRAASATCTSRPAARPAGRGCTTGCSGPSPGSTPSTRMRPPAGSGRPCCRPVWPTPAPVRRPPTHRRLDPPVRTASKRAAMS
ncbi:MAG: hypothetical protein AVDCRST_MAG61-2274, partial [uncultured Friedmanniella sp.]